MNPNLPSTESHFLVLPQADGRLPAWQIAVAASAVFNTVQNFVTLRFTKRLYNNVPATNPGISLPHISLTLRLIRSSSNTIAGPYVWDLDVNCVYSAIVRCVQHPQ